MSTMFVQGINLYYEVHGAGDSVVLIHGLGSSVRDWEFQVSELAKTYQIVTVDLRGHGQSDKPAGPYSIALFAADVAGLLRSLGTGAAHIVGLSLGGGVALQMALDAPELVRTLTVVNSAPELVVRTLQDRFMIWQRLVIVRLLGMRKMGEVLSQRLFIKPEQDLLRRTFVARWAENDQRAYLAAMQAMVGWTVTDRLGAIRCPTLIVSADQDYTPVTVKEAYTAKIPGARLVIIPDSRHATPVERPELFNRALQEFLADHA